MNEAGPIAALTPRGFALLQHRLYVEILDPEGATCAPTVRGEITLTGGFNPFLPLLRYRTGDFAALHFDGGVPRLVDLAGRPPVVFTGAAGETINNIDVTTALRPLRLAQYTLHQAADGALTLTVPTGSPGQAEARAALLGLFGADQPLAIVERDALQAPGSKLVQYTRDA
jgi:phenylacetate-CoA ligase